MKKIVYNYDNLDINEINRQVKRAKIIFINDNNEILLCFCHNNYFLVGGHVENDESDMICLEREIKEEVGIDIKLPELKPFFTIEYFNKDYPENNINTLSTINYYYFKKNILPDLNNTNYTDDEKEGNFKLEYININDAVKVLTDSLNNASIKGVVLDTIEVIKEYKKTLI